MDWIDDVKLEPIKISFVNTWFIINEEEKTVGCKLRFNIKGSKDAIKIINDFADDKFREVTAYARLHEGDVFDIESGKKVARARAESMAYRRFERMLCRITCQLMGVIDSFADFNEKTHNVIESNNKYIGKF